MGGALKAVGITILLLTYPFFSAYLVRQGFANLTLFALAGLTLWRSLNATSATFRIGGASVAAALLVGGYFATNYLIWLTPSLIYFGLAWLFGHTLWQPPSLCERLVRLQYPKFKPGIAEYLHGLTWLWTLFFAANIFVCALLPIVFGQRVWALYTGVGVYLLMGCLFAGEYLYRHKRFPDLDIPPALESIKFMVRNGHRLFSGVKR